MDQDRLPRPFWLQPLLSVSSRRRLFRRRFLRNTFHSSTSPICENIPSQSCHILKVSPRTFTLGIQRLVDRELRSHIHSDHSYIQGLSVAKATDLSLWFLSLSFPFFSALKIDIVIIGLCNGQQLTVLCHKIHLFSHRRCLLKCPISSHPGSLVKPPLKFLKTLQVSLGLNNNKKIYTLHFQSFFTCSMDMNLKSSTCQPQCRSWHYWPAKPLPRSDCLSILGLFLTTAPVTYIEHSRHSWCSWLKEPWASWGFIFDV